MPSYPAINDREFNLLKKIAENTADIAAGGGGGGAVASVNGQTGAVVLTSSDVGAQPLDADLTAIAALTTQAFGRNLLTMADAAATRTAIGAGTSSFDGVFASLTSKPTTLAGYGISDGITAAAVASGYQPLDADLTAIAALTTTAFGRAFLVLADAVATQAALPTIVADAGGWLVGEAWTYVSATTFSVASDVTAKYAKGDRIKLTQTTVKYFNVVNVSAFGGGITTITVTGGSDYTLANAAITLPFYSKEASPNGFPQWFNFAPALTGFSALPTTVIARFTITGRVCRVQLTSTGAGTSNATTLTATLPVPTSNVTNQFWMELCRGYNNGAQLTTPCMGFAFWNSSVWSFNVSISAAAWTASLGKMVEYAGLTYEF